MSTSSALPAIRSVLLLPKHVTPTVSHLPLLTSLQTLLNAAYTKTYCAHPELFGATHLRLASPAQLGDVIGKTGFTIVLFQDDRLVATGSAKDFGDGDVDTYAQWSSNLSGTEWVDKDKREKQSRENAEENEDKRVQKFEVTAFAVAPDAQGMGLGAKLLEEIEWLVKSNALYHARTLESSTLKDIKFSASDSTDVDGIDLELLKQIEHDTKPVMFKNDDQKTPKLVLMGIRELGNEAYYRRRGFKSIWDGTVPVGMWDARQPCTMIHMEKEI